MGDRLGILGAVGFLQVFFSLVSIEGLNQKLILNY